MTEIHFSKNHFNVRKKKEANQFELNSPSVALVHEVVHLLLCVWPIKLPTLDYVSTKYRIKKEKRVRIIVA